MTGIVRNLGPCQVRSATDRSCSRPAVMMLWGVPFCERCAREQEAYFAIGEFTQSSTDRREGRGLRDLRGGSLVEVLRGLRRSLASEGHNPRPRRRTTSQLESAGRDYREPRRREWG